MGFSEEKYRKRQNYGKLGVASVGITDIAKVQLDIRNRVKRKKRKKRKGN